MSLRFRRSVRLFPGVRLNFSRGGISTTVGVRGASFTLSSRGTYANLGIPGTGLSYRTRVSPSARRPQPALAEVHASSPFVPPDEGPESPRAIEVRSAAVGALTSPGLAELKELINQAAQRRRELEAQAARDQGGLDLARRRLRRARGFIVRIFTRKAIPRLLTAVDVAQAALESTRAELDGCYVEVDPGLDEPARVGLRELVAAFEQLSRCERIWDVTAVSKTDRVRERTTATQAVRRSAVAFDFSAPEAVRSNEPVMRLANASGGPIYLYPAFAMMTGSDGDFAIMEYCELEIDFSTTRFIESERVPSDSIIVGHTWAKANRDGSRDRRFADNYQIPIAQYGELLLQTPTGLMEAYQFSNADRTRAFYDALQRYRGVLARLTGSPPSDADPPAVDLGDDDADPPVPITHPEPKEAFVLDWVVLLGLAIALSWMFVNRDAIGERITTAFASPAPTVSAPPPSLPSVVRRTHKPHKRVVAAKEQEPVGLPSPPDVSAPATPSTSAPAPMADPAPTARDETPPY